MSLLRGKQVALSTLTGANTLPSIFSTNAGTDALNSYQYNARNQRIINVADPSAATDAVNLQTLQAYSQGITWKEPVRLATNGAILPNSPTVTATTATGSATITAGSVTQLVIDGVNAAVGDRILVKDEGLGGGLTDVYNGIYEVVDDGAGANPWEIIRTTDANSAIGNVGGTNKVAPGMAVIVEEGTAGLADTVWILTTNAPVGGIVLAGPSLGATSLTFALYPTAITYQAGNGINITGVTISVDLAATQVGKNASAYGGLQFNGNVPGDLSVKLENTAAASGANASNARGGMQISTNGGLSLSLKNTGGLEIDANADLAVDVAPNPVNNDSSATAEGAIQLTNNGVSLQIQGAGPGAGGLMITPTGAAVNAAANSPATPEANAEGGLKLTSNGLSAQLESSGSGTGGLTITTNGLAAKANNAAGIELLTGGISVALAPTAVGTGGLEFDINGEVQIDLATYTAGTGPGAYGGLQLAATGLSALIQAAGANSGGLQINNGGELRLFVDTTQGLLLTASGLAINAGPGLAFVSNQLVPDWTIAPGDLVAVAKSSAAGTANRVARADHTHASPQPVIDDKDLAGQVATAPGQQVVATGLQHTPAFSTGAAGGSYVAVMMNGVQYSVGDGVTTGCAFYFADPLSLGTAKFIEDIVSGDVLVLGDFTGGNQALFSIDTSDRFDFNYMAFYP